MGDPKKLKKKYSTPRHPWNAENIELDKKLIKEYGLRNKKEIWKMNSFLKKYKDQAKKLIAVKNPQGEKEKAQMLDKLQRLGLIQAGSQLDNILDLDIKDIMERRLQSVVSRSGLARSMKQARQFIVHRQVMVGDKKITFPSYLVSREEESQIRFDPTSALSDEEHPERVSLEKKEKTVEAPSAEETKKKMPAKKRKEEPKVPPAAEKTEEAKK